jgi:hypothetical protein
MILVQSTSKRNRTRRIDAVKCDLNHELGPIRCGRHRD